MPFWERVEILRQKQNVSYRWIASQMNICETTVSSMRKAGTEPRASEAVKIAKALGTTVEYLTCGNDSEYLRKYTSLKTAIQNALESN